MKTFEKKLLFKTLIILRWKNKMVAKELLKKLNSPESEFSAIPFWFLNDELEEEKIKYQIAQFKSKGIDVVIPHPRIGLPKNLIYLSDEYFQKIHFILTCCKEQDIKVILYDEGMYPSGAAGGIIAKNHPELKAKALFLSNDKQGQTIRDGQQGRLVYTYSQGRIRGIHYGEDDGDIEQPFAADILNPVAVDLFIKYTHEAYYENLKEFFGSTVIGFFTDEPNPCGRCRETCFAWYDGLEKDIVSNGGNLDELYALFNGKKNQTTRLYSKLIKAREVNIFYKKLKEWCNSHGIFLCGHSEKSDDVSQLFSFDVPGQDLVFRFVAPETGDTTSEHSVLGKVPADIAEYLGAQRNMCEVLGVCGKSDDSWHLPPSDIKWFLDYLAVRGTSAFVLHAFYFSLEGERKNERPPDVGMSNLWWDDYRYFSDYIKRVSFLNSEIKSAAKTAVVCNDGAVPVELVEPFYKNQIEFKYLPEFLIDNEKCVAAFKRIITSNEFDFNQLLEERAITFNNPQPDVRVNHFYKQSVEVAVISNVGEQEVNDVLRMTIKGRKVIYDLWTTDYYTVDKDEFDICLPARSCVAIIFDKEKSVKEKPYEKATKIRLCFEKILESDIEKRYVAEYIKCDGTNNVVSLEADEVVRWYINGEKVHVSFFNEHTLNIDKYAKTGKNTVEIRVLASACNIYGKKKIPFGLFGAD